MSYKYLTSSFLFTCFFIFGILIINADVISINSGGSDEIIIDSGGYIGGFFTGGDNTSSEDIEEESSSTTSTTTSTTSSGGTGGGGGGSTIGTIKEGELTINPSELSIIVIENLEETRQLKIKNIGGKSISISIELSGEELNEVLVIDNNNTILNPNQEKILELKINVKGKELIIGKILMKYSGFVKEVPIVIGSKSENFLFDISVFLSDKFKKIFVGKNIEAQFNLIEVGTNEKVDVVANYIIKDFEGNSHYEESETFFVLGEKNYMKEFPTQNLQEGKYVLGFEISYPGAFAVSSTTFSIEEKTKFNYKIILILISSLIFILIIILVVIKKQNRNLHIFKGKKKKIRRKK